jgi:rhodanese-related sulfurtransferase
MTAAPLNVAPLNVASLDAATLKQRRGDVVPPQIIDVRRTASFDADPRIIAGAIRRQPEAIANWAPVLEPWRPVVVYCVHGEEVSQAVSADLAARGFEARYLDHGLAGWLAAGGAVAPWRQPTRWVTRERPKIDRIACPWLIRRFVDADAQVFFVPNAEVRGFAAANAAEPFDIPDVRLTHVGERCSFDAFIDAYGLDDPALAEVATIVRGADTGALALAPEAAGLLGVSLGLSAMIDDDHALLRWGMMIYDALYARARAVAGETHGWRPESLR